MLEHLFDAELVYRSEMEPVTEDGDGELIGSGDGTVTGPRSRVSLPGRCSNGRGSSSVR